MKPTTYALCALLSWPIIAGMAFGGIEHRFNDGQLGYVDNFAIRDCRQHLGFSIAWGALASVLWPVTLPATFLVTGDAYDGIWTQYPATRCWP